MNPFASALFSLKVYEVPPPGFDIKLELLKPGQAERIERAIEDGELDGYKQLGKYWVRRSDLQELIGPGHCTYDETDDCYIPHSAV